jgi:predicted ribosome quality control (RQC) complex YloA/Tae2 family protein
MQSLTSLDLHFLLKEMDLDNSKIDKVFQKGSDIAFQIHTPGMGKRYLRVVLPSVMFLTDSKDEQEDTGQFALSLRKHITGERIRKVEQKEFERIVELSLDSKKIFIELFSPGNIILCGPEGKIIMAYTYKGFGSRMIRPNAIYEYPHRKYNLLALAEDELSELVENSNKASVVIMLATELGLGGMYSEEIIHRAGIDKTKTRLDKKEIRLLHTAIRDVLAEKTHAHISGTLILPFNPKSKDATRCDSGFNKEIEKAFGESPKEDRNSKEKEKLQAIIASQEERIDELRKEAQESQAKGEKVYENYELVSNLVRGIKDAKKKYSLQEMKEKLKDHPHIKKMTEKKISVDL